MNTAQQQLDELNAEGWAASGHQMSADELPSDWQHFVSQVLRPDLYRKYDRLTKAAAATGPVVPPTSRGRAKP